MGNLIFRGCIGNKLVTEIRMMMNVQTLFLPNFCGGAFYPEFRKLLNEASTNTYNVYHNPKKTISIKAAVAIWPEKEEMMA